VISLPTGYARANAVPLHWMSMDVFVMGEIRFGLLANPFVPITKRVDGKRCNLAHFFFKNVKNCGDKRKLLEIILLREQDGFFLFSFS
jgi:hypothetical protein